jgi:hypothetical protein
VRPGRAHPSTQGRVLACASLTPAARWSIRAAVSRCEAPRTAPPMSASRPSCSAIHLLAGTRVRRCGLARRTPTSSLCAALWHARARAMPRVVRVEANRVLQPVVRRTKVLWCVCVRRWGKNPMLVCLSPEPTQDPGRPRHCRRKARRRGSAPRAREPSHGGRIPPGNRSEPGSWATCGDPARRDPAKAQRA